MASEWFMVNGRRAGQFKDGILVKQGKQVQLFRVFDGFGVSTEVLRNPRVTHIEVHYQDKVYLASTQAFWDYGIAYQKPGFEEQMVLPRKWWITSEANQTVLLEDV